MEPCIFAIDGIRHLYWMGKFNILDCKRGIWQIVC